MGLRVKVPACPTVAQRLWFKVASASTHSSRALGRRAGFQGCALGGGLLGLASDHRTHVAGEAVPVLFVAGGKRHPGELDAPLAGAKPGFGTGGDDAIARSRPTREVRHPDAVPACVRRREGLGEGSRGLPFVALLENPIAILGARMAIAQDAQGTEGQAPDQPGQGQVERGQAPQTAVGGIAPRARRVAPRRRPPRPRR